MNSLTTVVLKFAATCSICVFCSPVNADLLADFQKAVENKNGGCRSIPYGSLQDKCVSKQAEVDRYCKEGAFSCDQFDPQGLQKNIDQLQGKIADLNNKRSELSRARDQLKSKLSSTSDDSEKRGLEDQLKRVEYEDESAKNEIYEHGKKTDDWKRQLDSEKKEISDRIYNGKNCVSARVDMQKIFGEAYTTADRETDSAISAEAGKLMPVWTEGQKTHSEALSRAQTAVEKCGRML